MVVSVWNVQRMLSGEEYKEITYHDDNFSKIRYTLPTNKKRIDVLSLTTRFSVDSQLVLGPQQTLAIILELNTSGPT